MVVHAVRRLPKAEWHNDRDQFMRPNAPLPEEFITDCTVWNLFHKSNHTVAMKDVVYEGVTYQVPNHFFPLPLRAIRGLPISDGDITMQLSTAQERFVAVWVMARSLSAEALTLFQAGEVAYRTYFAELHQLRTGKFKIDTWDAGWWQVRSALKERDLGKTELVAVKDAHDALRDKLRPKLTEFGFLPATIGL